MTESQRKQVPSPALASRGHPLPQAGEGKERAGEFACINFDPNSETLEVEFLKSGKVYEYYNVPAFMHERLMEAPSVGVFFNAEIKNTYACNPL